MCYRLVRFLAVAYNGKHCILDLSLIDLLLIFPIWIVLYYFSIKSSDKLRNFSKLLRKYIFQVDLFKTSRTVAPLLGMDSIFDWKALPNSVQYSGHRSSPN